MGVGGYRYAPAALPLVKRPGTHCTRGWWPVWMDAENLVPRGIGSPDYTARSELLYRLNYASPRT